MQCRTENHLRATRALASLLALGSSLAACEGPAGPAGTNGVDGIDGQDGTDGTDGTDGVDGEDGTDGSDGVDGIDGEDGEDGEDGFGMFDPANLDIHFAALSADQTADDTLQIDFALTDGTDPVLGVDSSVLRFYIAELVPGDAATDSDQWHRWVYERDREGYPFGTLEDLGDGQYRYTFATLLTDAPDVANQQRMMMRVRGLDGYNAVNGHYDFALDDVSVELPAARDIVTAEACNDCHGSNINDHGHGGGYTDPRSCVLCHSPLYEGAAMADAGFDAVTMFHQVHMAIDGTATAAAPADAMDWSGIRFPGDMMDCETCHQGTEGENWKTRPTQDGCDSCHVTVDFTGADFEGINGTTYAHSVQSDNANCALCHTPTAIESAHPLSEAERTLSTTITDVSIDEDGAGGGTGQVTVTFTADVSGTAVTTSSAFSGMAFTLAKLVPGEDGQSNHWVSYTSRTRSKSHPGVAPVVLQGYSESASQGTLTHVGSPDGTWTYTFALSGQADVAGDIRTITHATDTNNSSVVTANVVPFERDLTHRVGMEVRDAGGVPNVTNATFDWVPSGDPVTETRDLVDRTTCDACHDGQRLHKGYAIEYCVTCHNQSTFDPYTEAAPVTVDLQTIVHKLHRGADLANPYDVSHHDYSDVVFPQRITNCESCHTNDGWTQNPNSRACATCHDGEAALAHVTLNTTDDGYEACSVCHDDDRMAPVREAHQGVSR